MFRMAASKGLLVIQSSRANAKSHFLCRVCMWELLYTRCKHTCLMQVKVKVWRLF